MKVAVAILFIIFSCGAVGQVAYEAEEFVSDNDLKFELQQMQKSKYIGSAIVCEKETTASCDSVANITFESSKGKIQLPVASFTFV